MFSSAPCKRTLYYFFLTCVPLGLGGCGESNSTSSVAKNPTWQPGVYAEAETYADFCAAPRAGTNPATQSPYPDKRGNETFEKFWLRSISHETYLWPDEIPDVNPSSYSLADYFHKLKTPALTASGSPKDKFHFFENADDYYKSFILGESLSYGITWTLIQNTLVVAFVEPSSPAAAAGILRGSRVTTINDRDVATLNDTEWAEALYPLNDKPRKFSLTHPTVANGFSVTLKPVTLRTEAVHNTKVIDSGNGGKIGYMTFQAFDGTAEKGLIDAVNQLNTASVTDLVLDLRYNGGGAITIAAELAYMIAGANKTQDKVFSNTRYNPNLEKYYQTEKIDTRDYFLPTSSGFGDRTTANIPLPALNIQRLYVLTGKYSCSASELLINSLRGIDFPVIQIGETTCGKPYGFFNLQNCGKRYFTINIQTINAKGFGDYYDGFSPTDITANQGSPVGCPVTNDDYRELGDPEERLFATAIHHIETGQCGVSNAQVRGLHAIGESDTPLRHRLERPFHQQNMTRDLLKKQ